MPPKPRQRRKRKLQPEDNAQTTDNNLDQREGHNGTDGAEKTQKRPRRRGGDGSA
eukprot:CAMPEP_0202015216 /NCGR_PEP_ID=MMETSP0905-20130828/31368_1 /ASSEMBLY_ACC=CAM_ASM_000554 /TAXON_ID=420261 /ORGANISM="Thalassiosira antarctica, Strain CCMP982" /LENGTH=54 /DNA_ID=CAMNT_0048575313 /DNA_START=9 /DNA_END=170 /DNA_ORIENTATION=+